MEPRYQPHHHSFSGAHVSLGSVKYALGLTACSMLAEKIKTPEQRYLVIAAIGAGIGALETAWQDYRKSREREERESERKQCWRERISERNGRSEGAKVPDRAAHR
jgi:hypothetical protein